MTLQLDLAALSAATLAATAAVLTVLLARAPRYAGTGLWMLAPWLAAAGALAAIPPWSALPAAVLLLAAPVAMLAGLRRFHPRQPPAGPAATAPLAWAAGAALLALAAAFGEPAGTGPDAPVSGALAALALACLAVHAAVAGALWPLGPLGPLRPLRPLRAQQGSQQGAQQVPQQAPLRQRALALAVVATGALPWLLPLLHPGWAPDAAGLRALVQAWAAAVALAAGPLACLALARTHERTAERLRASRRRLRALANLDALTQLPNRRHFGDLAAHALRRDPPGSAVLVAFDIDHFKRINDRLGHAAGDRALCLVAQALIRQLRTDDLPGRHGGDEFVLLLRGTDTGTAMAVAARIAASVQRRAQAQALPPVGLSFGLVQVQPGEALAEALRRADQALYEAKRQGRSRAVAAAGDERHPVFGESRRLGLTPG
jgi:diguanylate cyclase (GGDEF)-like protein